MAVETQGYPIPLFFVPCPIDLDSKLSSPQEWGEILFWESVFPA